MCKRRVLVDALRLIDPGALERRGEADGGDGTERRRMGRAPARAGQARPEGLS
jgi:hypothetical protein